jgi:uncharacterized protein (DUF2345 family)
MIAPRQIRTQSRRTTQELVNTGTAGPFLAKVIGHLDQTFMGGLKVQLLRTTSSADNDSQDGEIVTVQYASPFSGATPIYGAGGADNYSNTQKSYGFWAVPPDVGSKVLVTFVEGRRDFGFWFACVQDDFMNFMIPDGRAATLNTSSNTPEFLNGKKLPVGEYNKHLVDPQGQAQPTYFPRPINDDYISRMEEQGLLEDDIRGITTTSARREVPSNVYGMSTPGPLDKRPDAPKVPRGTVESETLFFSSRLGGHSIVMDDGDEKILRKGSPSDTPQEYVNLKVNESGGDLTRPANELFRIRTRTGHQIVLHNTEDLIYISNARGTAWIELTSNGKIDIYAQDSISVHSEGDFNFTAARDINLNAGANINVSAVGSIKNNAGTNYDLTTGGYIAGNAGESVNWNAGTFLSGAAGTSLTMSANGGDLVCQASGSSHLHAGATVGILGDSGIRIAANSSIHVLADGILHCTGDRVDVHSRGNLNLQARNDLNMLAATNAKLQGSNFDVLASGNIKLTPTGGKLEILAGTSVDIDAPAVNLNGGAASSAVPAGTATPASSPPAPNPQPPTPPMEAELPARIPQHEPWFQHENLNPLLYTLDKTRAGSGSQDTFVPPIPDTFVNFLTQDGSSTTVSYTYPNGFRDYSDGGDFEAEGETPYQGGGVGLTPNAKIAMDYFTGKGLTPAQAAGIVGNLQKESGPGVNPNAEGDSGNAWGIAQWNEQWSGERVENFQLVIGRPLRGSSLEQQLDFIWWELTGEPSVSTPTVDSQSRRGYTKLKAVNTGNGLNDSYKVALIFEDEYERSADKEGGLAERGRNAQRIYRDYVGGFNSDDVPAYGALPEERDPASGAPYIVDPSTGRLQDRVIQSYSAGTDRDRPINERLIAVLNRAAHLTGIERVTVYSGRQPGTRGTRVGTTRHDTGDAADLYLTVGGSVVNSSNSAGRQLISKYVAACVSLGALGLGHSPGYMGDRNIHIDLLGADIGGGRYDRRTLVIWKSDSWFKEACRNGYSNRGNLA